MNREELLKIAKPILFNTEMVQAILEDRKTVTRRVVKPQNELTYFIELDGKNAQFGECEIDGYKGCMYEQKMPHQVGDILYVRETWAKLTDTKGNSRFVYRATDIYPFGEKYICKFRWKPSIHMPKKAARIFLRVTDIRVERLQDITEEQARKEGCIDYHDKIGNGKFVDVLEFDLTAKEAFAELWNSTVKKQDLEQYGWNSNPWVWVIEFERVEVKQ